MLRPDLNKLETALQRLVSAYDNLCRLEEEQDESELSHAQS